MYSQNAFSPFIPLIIFALALLIDLAVGEPPIRLHPTVWMGKVIAFLEARMKNKKSRTEKANGILLGLSTIILFTLSTYLMLLLIQRYFNQIVYVIAAAMLLKTTFAIKCMESYTLSIARTVEKGDIDEARRLLPCIVRRDPRKLNSRQIISAAVESIAEGTVDGVTSPFFYFALLGVPGAVAFRAVNTLDSMVGYKDPEHINIGWFSARLDTLANYIPARITAFLMILAAWLLDEDWKNAWRILRRDRNRTESLNAGWTMSAMAGALNVQLEKPGFYILGDNRADLSPAHIQRALHLMKLTIYMFAVLVVIPLTIWTTFVGEGVDLFL